MSRYEYSFFVAQASRMRPRSAGGIGGAVISEGLAFGDTSGVELVGVGRAEGLEIGLESVDPVELGVEFRVGVDVRIGAPRTAGVTGIGVEPVGAGLADLGGKRRLGLASAGFRLVDVRLLDLKVRGRAP
jgi:hypothetical protein